MTLNHTPKQSAPHTSKLTTGILILIVVVLPFLFKEHLVSEKPAKETHALSLPKQTILPVDDETDTKQDDWIKLKAQKGDSLAKIFKTVGIKHSTLSRLMKESKHQNNLSHLSPGDEIQIKLAKDKRLLQFVIYLTLNEKLTISQHDNNHFHEKLDTLTAQNHAHYISATVEHSLYYTIKKNKIPQQLLKQLVDIFSEQIDFNREIRANDKFTIIYNRIYVNDKRVAIGDIVAASFTNKKNTFYAIGYPNQSGKMSYYTPKGKSLQLGFDRFPIEYTHVGSSFNLHRYHPILHTTRAHKGIDLAAPIGTPIKAVADGYITQIGINGGYGNMIKIRHSQKYETVYGHMLRFKKGLTRGKKVLRGELIGYVGQTGLATGPHCHYEFRIHNRSVNPATVKLPSAPGVNRKKLAKFKSQANTLLSQIKLYQDATLHG